MPDENMMAPVYKQLTPADEKTIQNALRVFVGLLEGTVPSNVAGLFKDEETAKSVYEHIRLPIEALSDDVARHLPGGNPEPAKMVMLAFQRLIAAIDAKLSSLLSQIMHARKFRELEGSWRGLKFLVSNSETGTSLKIKVLSAKKDELRKDFDKASDF